jgi:Protein of unknown function (DUF3047)
VGGTLTIARDSCDSNNEHSISSSRGFLKQPLFFCALTALIYQALASPLAFTALNPAGLNPGQSGQVPKGWQVKVNHGQADISVCTYEERPCLRLKSVKASFALQRDVDIDPAQMPMLTWNWKVTQLPRGGDFRRAATDDEAAQLLVAFDDRRVLSYIWDSTAPKGEIQNASFFPLVHIFGVVCQSGSADLNRWMTENHDVAADFQRAYGKPAPRVKALRIQINSQHTGTVAESYFGGVEFHSSQQ